MRRSVSLVAVVLILAFTHSAAVHAAQSRLFTLQPDRGLNGGSEDVNADGLCVLVDEDSLKDGLENCAPAEDTNGNGICEAREDLNGDRQCTVIPDDGGIRRGKDTAIWNDREDNDGNSQRASVSHDTCPPAPTVGDAIGRGYLRFALEGLPVRGILSAKVVLHMSVRNRGKAWPANPVIGLRRITGEWEEMPLAYATRPGSDPAEDLPSGNTQTVEGATELTEGELLDPMPEDPDDPAHPPHLTFDITDLYRQWADGQVPNYGLLITQENPLCLYDEMTGGYADMYYWTSDCGVVSRRPRLEVTTNLVFADDFSDGVVGQQDPQWEVLNGAWKVNAPSGYSGGQVLKSSTATVATALVQDAQYPFPFVSGRITARLKIFKVATLTTLADMRFLFDSPVKGKYRCVEIRQLSTGWVLRLLQAGSYDGDMARIVKTVKLLGFRKKNWLRLEIDVAPGGGVSATLYDEVTAKKWTVSGTFLQNTGGDVGVLTKATSLLVDDYLLEADPVAP